jgi:Bacterial lectin
MRRNVLARCGLAAAVLTTALAMPSAAALASTGPSVLYQENFTGPDTPAGDWIAKSTGGKSRPCLTAATAAVTGGIPECTESANGARKPDLAGSGAFEVTGNDKGESGFGLFTRPLDTSKGIQVDFDVFQHNAHTYKDSFGARGGDGIAFFLINGAASPAAAGDAGGSLGYRNLPGGVIGIGFDEFGNFSDPRWGGTGGPGETPNSVVLRGADSTGYRYIAGVKAPGPLAVDSAVQRAGAKRHVTITVSTKNVLDVYVNFVNGKGPVRVLGPIDLNTIKGQPQLPPTVKFGFAAATGAATNFHEVQGMTVTGLPPDLRLAVSHAGTFKPGGTGSFQLATSDDPGAGPTTGAATVVFHVPDGLTPRTPSGDGWQCSAGGQAVTCTRPDVLQPGSSYPVINVPVSVASGTTGTVTATGSVSDPADTGTVDKTVSDLVTIGALSPDLSISSTTTGSFAPGGTGSYVYTVSDSPQAGPTTGPVTVTVPVPTGMTPVSAAGNGWSCSISGQTVTCTNSGVVQPGASAAPLTVNVSVPHGTAGQLTTTASANTSGDTSPQTATASDTVTITPPPPNLAVAVSGPGTVKAGGTGSFTLTTSNAADAGPTTGPVTATFNVPDGMTARSATGTGWACSVSGQRVTCTRPGSAADALDGGAAYPPVTVVVSVPATASGTVPVAAAVGTTGDSGQPGETAQATVTVTPLAPDLGVAVTAAQATAGHPATITLVATDAPAAGPVTGTSTVTFPVPAGYPVASVTGDGWQCTRAVSVSCTRHDGLAPGDSFPPVTITLTVPATASGKVPLGAAAGTDGQGGTNTATGSLMVTAVPPKLLLTVGDQGVFTAGKSGGGYVLGVSADATGGPVTGPVTVSFPLPGGMTAVSATGSGWNCAFAGSGSRVTCTRNDPLAPGGAYPPITVTTAVPPSLSGSVTASGSASTGGVSASGSDTLTIGQPAPQVSVAITSPDSLTAGGTGTYTLVASNDSSGGPTTGPVTVTFKVPDGVDAGPASGDGWQCTVDGRLVTCTRGDVLQPGDSLPPIQVGVTIPATWPSSDDLTVTGSVSTPDNGAATGTQVTSQIPVTPLPPDLAVDVSATATATAGATDTAGVTVTAGPAGGPVTDPVTVTIPAPPGMTPGSASGNGWNCGDMHRRYGGFVCVTVGGLDPGDSYPPIRTQWNVSGGMTGTVPVHATCYTADQADLGGVQGSARVDVTAGAPDVTTSVISSGAVAAGGTEDVTVSVGDAAGSGPTTGDVSVTLPMPEQLHPRSAYGYGWNCSMFSQDVTCQRPRGGDELPPGGQYPPITMSGYAASAWAGTGLRASVDSG